jgi:hypothetical protein
MPIPNPSKNESENDFISRCVSEISGEYDQEQSLGICYTSWEKENMSDEMEQFKTLPQGDCLSKAKSAGYTDEYAKWACSKPKSNDGQQGGVAMSEEFGRTKFEFPPTHKEAMNEYMARCMSNAMVRERKPHRPTRAGFCYSNYQNNYINNIGKNWK